MSASVFVGGIVPSNKYHLLGLVIGSLTSFLSGCKNFPTAFPPNSMPAQWELALEIRYTLKCPDPEKEIARVLEGLGANNVRPSSTYNGARYDYRLNDIIDERDFKRKASDVLRRSGFRAN